MEEEEGTASISAAEVRSVIYKMTVQNLIQIWPTQLISLWLETIEQKTSVEHYVSWAEFVLVVVTSLH